MQFPQIRAEYSSQATSGSFGRTRFTSPLTRRAFEEGKPLPSVVYSFFTLTREIWQANYKIMAARLQHEIKELQQKVKAAKLRLESEAKVN